MNLPIQDSSIPAWRDGVNVTEIGSELVIYDASRLKMMRLDQTGALVFRLCDGQRTVGSIIEILSEAFPEAPRRLSKDVHEMLQRLVRADVLALGKP